jgi:hypothetical protein
MKNNVKGTTNRETISCDDDIDNVSVKNSSNLIRMPNKLSKLLNREIVCKS